MVWGDSGLPDFRVAHGLDPELEEQGVMVFRYLKNLVDQAGHSDQALRDVVGGQVGFLHLAAELIQPEIQNVQKNVLFAGKVMVKGALTDPGGVTNFGHTGAVVAVQAKQPRGRR